MPDQCVWRSRMTSQGNSREVGDCCGSRRCRRPAGCLNRPHQSRLHPSAQRGRAGRGSRLTGAALGTRGTEQKIGLLRTKNHLIQILAQKQTLLKQAQNLVDQLKNIPLSGWLHEITLVSPDIALSQSANRN